MLNGSTRPRWPTGMCSPIDHCYWWQLDGMKVVLLKPSFWRSVLRCLPVRSGRNSYVDITGQERTARAGAQSVNLTLRSNCSCTLAVDVVWISVVMCAAGKVSLLLCDRLRHGRSSTWGVLPEVLRTKSLNCSRNWMRRYVITLFLYHYFYLCRLCYLIV